MPVYAQPTEFNERLTSMMSCILCNSNDLYNGHVVDMANFSTSVAPPHIQHLRPLFTDAILRKARTLIELERMQEASAKTTKVSVVLEVVLVAVPQDENRCRTLTYIISQLFSMPEDQSNKFLLEITTARSHAIREDLTAARSSRHPLGGSVQRRQIFVALGSALQGMCLYLAKEQAMQLQSSSYRRTTSTRRRSPSPLSIMLAVVCVDPPSHLWKSCGRFLLDHTSLKKIPSLFVGYSEKDENGGERIHAGLGELLKDCKAYPHSLALIAKESGNILRRPRNLTPKDDSREFDAFVWLARLLVKYIESVQSIRTPPRWASNVRPGKDEGPGRSML